MCLPKLKRELVLTLVVSVAFLCGCAHQYLMDLSNGDKILSLSKPKPQGSIYRFTDTSGTELVIARNRVVKIETVSVVKEEEKPSSPTKPKRPKHWYFLWLA
jgi:hypothetical protein